MKEPTQENIVQWVNENIKNPCTNCQHKDFTLGNQFGLVDLLDFDSPQEITQPKRMVHMKLIIMLCKNCGKTEFYDVHTAGFLKRLK